MKKYRCLNKTVYFSNNISFFAVNKMDIEIIRLWRNAQINVLRQIKKIQKKQQQEYFQYQIWPEMLKKYPKNILLSIKLKNQLIGYGGLTNISWYNRRAEISFLLNNKLIKNKQFYKMIFSEFLTLLKKIAFKELKLNKIYTETYSSRKFHISILKKNDFKLEGKLKKHVYIINKFQDSLLHAIIKR